MKTWKFFHQRFVRMEEFSSERRKLLPLRKVEQLNLQTNNRLNLEKKKKLRYSYPHLGFNDDAAIYLGYLICNDDTEKKR